MDNDDCDDSEGEIGGFKDNYHGQITDSMLCARHPQEKDACQVRECNVPTKLRVIACSYLAFC